MVVVIDYLPRAPVLRDAVQDHGFRWMFLK